VAGRELLIASRSSRNGHWKEAVVIVREILKRYAYLPQIINASNTLGSRFNLAHSRQEERCQNSNNGYNAKQFEQGKGSVAAPDTHGFHNLRSAQHRQCRAQPSLNPPKACRFLREPHAKGVRMTQIQMPTGYYDVRNHGVCVQLMTVITGASAQPVSPTTAARIMGSRGAHNVWRSNALTIPTSDPAPVMSGMKTACNRAARCVGVVRL
jgi:hypothetical protein